MIAQTVQNKHSNRKILSRIILSLIFNKTQGMTEKGFPENWGGGDLDSTGASIKSSFPSNPLKRLPSGYLIISHPAVMSHAQE